MGAPMRLKALALATAPTNQGFAEAIYRFDLVMGYRELAQSVRSVDQSGATFVYSDGWHAVPRQRAATAAPAIRERSDRWEVQITGSWSLVQVGDPQCGRSDRRELRARGARWRTIDGARGCC